MKLDRFARFAWGVLTYNLGVILWGAYVRATGSGAGCGSHWPLCNGDVVPRAAEIETLIEFTHRITSGFALVAVGALFFWSRRAYPVRHRVRTGSALSLVFVILEALLGAGLVLFELVADDTSWFRAIAMVAHLMNTFVLIAVLALTAWWASGGAAIRWSGSSAASRLLAIAIAGMLLVGASGAVAALGDTLFPAETLGSGIRDSFSRDSHPLIQLRKYHPLLAILVGSYIVAVARYLARPVAPGAIRKIAAFLTGLYITQILAGAVNVILLAPVTMQLVHLLLADAVWIALVLFTAAALAVPVPVVGGAIPGGPRRGVASSAG